MPPAGIAGCRIYRCGPLCFREPASAEEITEVVARAVSAFLAALRPDDVIAQGQGDAGMRKLDP